MTNNQAGIDYVIVGDEATKVSNEYRHYEELRERAKLLCERVLQNIQYSYVEPEFHEEVSRYDIYRIEGVNQLLNLALATNTRQGKDIRSEIIAAIAEDREVNSELESKYGES